MAEEAVMASRAEVQHLTIVGDRFAGKTKLLVDVAIDEAARQGRKVLFFTPNREQDAWTLKLIEDRAKDLVGAGEVKRVYVSKGRERIVFTSGGEVFFSLSKNDDIDSIDTHIIDDVHGGESWVGATRIFRGMMR